MSNTQSQHGRRRDSNRHDHHPSSRIVTLEFVGIPDKIRGMAIGRKGAIQKLVTGRGNRDPGFLLERYSVEDDHAAKSKCFKIVIRGLPTDVLRAQFFIQHHISDSLAKSIGGLRGQTSLAQRDYWKAFSWVPLSAVTTTSLCLSIAPQLREKFYPSSQQDPRGFMRDNDFEVHPGHPPHTRAVLEFDAVSGAGRPLCTALPTLCLRAGCAV